MTDKAIRTRRALAIGGIGVTCVALALLWRARGVGTLTIDISSSNKTRARWTVTMGPVSRAGLTPEEGEAVVCQAARWLRPSRVQLIETTFLLEEEKSALGRILHVADHKGISFRPQHFGCFSHEAMIAWSIRKVQEAIAGYRKDHGDRLPCWGADGRLDPAGFFVRLTSRTTEDDTVTESEDGLGPYVTHIPWNYFACKPCQVRFGDESTLGKGDEGWHFNVKAGRFSANDPLHTDPYPPPAL